MTKVMLTVSGPTGSGKSRILAEVEIALRAIGVSVTWANKDTRNEVHSEHWAESSGAWQPELPDVELLEVNIPIRSTTSSVGEMENRMSGPQPPSDAPIEPLEYLGGVKVVDIGDIRVARGMSRRPASACRHFQLRYDASERRIWCADCEQNIEGFDAFELLVGWFDGAAKKLQRRAEELAAAETHQVRSLAARQLDMAWRSRRMVPACPCCGQGLFPEDFKNGIMASLGREYAEAQRRRRKGRLP